MLGGNWKPVGLYGVIAAVSLGAFAGGRGTEVAVAAGLVASAGVVLFARRRLGGFTGDVLGAAGDRGRDGCARGGGGQVVSRPLAVAGRNGRRRGRGRASTPTASGRRCSAAACSAWRPCCYRRSAGERCRARDDAVIALGVAAGACDALDGGRDVPARRPVARSATRRPRSTVRSRAGDIERARALLPHARRPRPGGPRREGRSAGQWSSRWPRTPSTRSSRPRCGRWSQAPLA